MVCGTSSFKHLDGDDDPRAPMATSPKGSKKKASNKIKNPYSTRGLDKFSAVLSELESRRQKIMARAGSQGVAMVQFMHESTNDWIPIVVRPRDRKVDEENKVSGAQKPAPALAGDGGAGEGAGGAKKKTVAAKEERNKGNKGFAWRGWRESHSWVLVVVVILVCIVVFGRAFAICCTCICWYLVPSMNERGGGGGSKKGREYARRLSEKRLGANSRVLANKVMNNNMGRRE